MIAFFISIFVAFIWANGIHKMDENHPDYKGDDFLDWDNNHTENEF